MGKDNLYNLNDSNESSDEKVSNDQFIAKKRKNPFDHNQAKEKINTLSKSEYGQKYLTHIDKKVQECRQKLSPSDIDASIEQNKHIMIPFLIYTQNTLLIYGNKKKIVAKEKEKEILEF